LQLPSDSVLLAVMLALLLLAEVAALRPLTTEPLLPTGLVLPTQLVLATEPLLPTDPLRCCRRIRCWELSCCR
jgi:hypothetical protein